MYRLNLVFAGNTGLIVGFIVRWRKYFALNHAKSFQIYFFYVKRQAKTDFSKAVERRVVNVGRFSVLSKQSGHNCRPAIMHNALVQNGPGQATKFLLAFAKCADLHHPAHAQGLIRAFALH